MYYLFLSFLSLSVFPGSCLQIILIGVIFRGTILVQFPVVIIVMVVMVCIIIVGFFMFCVLIRSAVVFSFGVSVLPWLAIGFVVLAFIMATIGIWLFVLQVKLLSVKVNVVVLFVCFCYVFPGW